MASITVDTNIYVSGLIFRRGNPSRLLELAETGVVKVAICDAIFEEIADVLKRKFDWPDDDIGEAQRRVASYTYRVEPTEVLNVIRADPDDDRILECAVAAKSEYIVSGDRHLLKLGRFENIPIVTVAQFLDVALKREETPDG